MSDFNRLRQKLSKLRMRERRVASARALGAAEDAISAIVAEIDETILPRRLSFSTEGGPAVHLAVANRRLQALVAPAPETPGAAGLEGVAIKDVEDPNLAALREVLLSAFGSAEALVVATARQSAPGFPSDVGVPSVQLAKAWDLGEPGSTGFDAAFDAAAKQALAWLKIEGEDVAGQGGDGALLSALETQAAAFLDTYLARRGELDGFSEGARVLGFSAAAAGKAVVFVDAAPAMGFLVADAAHVGRIVTRLQSGLTG